MMGSYWKYKNRNKIDFYSLCTNTYSRVPLMDKNGWRNYSNISRQTNTKKGKKHKINKFML